MGSSPCSSHGRPDAWCRKLGSGSFLPSWCRAGVSRSLPVLPAAPPVIPGWQRWGAWLRLEGMRLWFVLKHGRLRSSAAVSWHGATGGCGDGAAQSPV